MNPSIFRISLDIHDEGSQVSLAVKKGDTIRVIQATLTERGRPYTITAGCTAVFTAKKPDGSILYNACTVSGSGITYAMTPQTTAAAGRADCEFRLYDAADELITSPRFNIVICDTVYDDDDVIESTSEATALTELIDEATELIETVESKLANGEFDGADGQAATIEVGQTVTGEAGSPAAVANTGTANAAVLHFTIPKGEKGDAGAQGEKGEAGKAPYIGEDGQWYAWDEDSGAYEDTGVSSTTLVDENSGQRVRMWFGTIAEYNALPEIRADTYYNILEGVVT